GKKEDGMALLKEAAGKGCAYAQFFLGTLYSMDDNGEKAVEYFSMAATQLMTEEEVVFDLIPEMADTLKKQTLKLNLKNGNITNISIVISQIMLGAAYGSGLWGIEQDKEIAKEWYKLAGRNGWADADKAIKALDE
ncbi:MAG: SEL1-like repeat protein, partial [Lentisphaeria bacterium]|nr:SEL1-like repeat protein [Lentisphaeria bacterium]